MGRWLSTALFAGLIGTLAAWFVGCAVLALGFLVAPQRAADAGHQAFLAAWPILFGAALVLSGRPQQKRP